LVWIFNNYLDVIASAFCEVIPSLKKQDCFVAMLLAMTELMEFPIDH
jgi:hypothetical protein